MLVDEILQVEFSYNFEVYWTEMHLLQEWLLSCAGCYVKEGRSQVLQDQ